MRTAQVKLDIMKRAKEEDLRCVQGLKTEETREQLEQQVKDLLKAREDYLLQSDARWA